MFESADGYVFVTFQDGNVIFYKDSYERHCGYHDVIRGEHGREALQNALPNPDYITSYSRKDILNVSCKKYYHVIGKIKTTRGIEFEYWEIVLQKKSDARFKIVTAYTTSALKYAMINNRVEKIVYRKNQHEEQ